MDGMSFSTAFSGIGGPENAIDGLAKGLAVFAGREPATKSYFAFDMRRECREELAVLPHPPECIH
eukprot:10524685-Alexandrium_andersonii.AAC.1